MMDFYEILEISPNASKVVIRASYKTLMQHYHPDKTSNDPEKAQLILAIRLAYEVLSDPERREAYDIELEKFKATGTEFSKNKTFEEVSTGSAPENSRSSPLQVIETIIRTKILNQTINLYNCTNLLNYYKLWRIIEGKLRSVCPFGPHFSTLFHNRRIIIAFVWGGKFILV